MIASSGFTIDTSSFDNFNLTTTTSSSSGYYELYWEYDEEYSKPKHVWVEPLSHKPLKGTFRQSRGSYKGISKSARNKSKKLNFKRR